MLALDLFCCGGGAGMGLKQAGFDVVGVDINQQPKYPFKFIKSCAIDFLKNTDLSEFDFLWASPPCQAHTKAKKLQGNEHECFIERVRELFERSGKPWCIENVVGAPLKNPILLCGTMFGIKTYRHRLFECSFPIKQPYHPPHRQKQVKMGRPVKDGDYIQIVGHFSGVKYAQKVMGIDWLGQNELREAIPPCYSKFIAETFLKNED